MDSPIGPGGPLPAAVSLAPAGGSPAADTVCTGLEAADTTTVLPVSVVTVTYNSDHCVARALASVPDALERIVVDNASADRSCEVAAPLASAIIRNARNVGFGAACNKGATQARGEFLLFLNPDATLASHALERLVAAARAFPQAVAFGPRGEFPQPADVEADVRATLTRAQDRQRSVGAPAPGGFRDMSSLSGAALLCRTSVFRDVGGFDEGFFLYFEDEDLCRRLAGRGTLILDADAVYYHLPGTGARLTPRQRFAKYRHYGHARVRFGRKYATGFRPLGAAIEQAAKGVFAFLTADVARSAQHFGRAVGYFEGGRGDRDR